MSSEMENNTAEEIDVEKDSNDKDVTMSATSVREPTFGGGYAWE